MSRTNQLPTSIRNIRARLRPFKQPIVWGSLAFLLLLTVCIWEFWHNPEQFFSLNIEENSDNAAPGSTTTLDAESRRIAADIDTSDILAQLKPPPAVINSTQLQSQPQTKTTPKPAPSRGTPEKNLSPQANSDRPTPPGANQIPTNANPLNVTSFGDSLLGLSPGVGTNRQVGEAMGQFPPPPISAYSSPNNPLSLIPDVNSTPPINPLLSAVQQYPIVPGGPLGVAPGGGYGGTNPNYSSNPYMGSTPAMANYGSNPGSSQAPVIPNYGNNYGNNPNTYPVPVLPNYSNNPYIYQQNPLSGNANNLGQQPSSLPVSGSSPSQTPPLSVAPGFPTEGAATAFPEQTMAPGISEETTRGLAGSNSGAGIPIMPVAPALDAAPNNAYNYLLRSTPPIPPPSGTVVVPGGVGAPSSLPPGSSLPVDGQPNRAVIDNYQNQLVQPDLVPNGAAPNSGMPLSSPDSLPKLE
ncbi:MAG TPA: hypothetical protein IGS52_15290 [Oscillatoriaceae cyanobacterium M33_DOE_052]|uniref:Uncharacterized protein n=1 Tax=Planktothricoides sp. SpSt-374 TaxID=2282167 RepID=A0A7C3ZR88_9CYAN|nr:hypothetical protein [Oscillatoriaceae cyanobacterium M33_DOE_052]